MDEEKNYSSSLLAISQPGGGHFPGHWLHVVNGELLLPFSFFDKLSALGEASLKKRENLGKIPKGGRGLKKTGENSRFQFRNFENPGGVLYFSKMSELKIKLLDSIQNKKK